MRSSVLFRVDLNDLVHIVEHVRRGPRGKHDCWTPFCMPNEDWLILKESASNGPPTCLWCLVGQRCK